MCAAIQREGARSLTKGDDASIEGQRGPHASVASPEHLGGCASLVILIRQRWRRCGSSGVCSRTCASCANRGVVHNPAQRGVCMTEAESARRRFQACNGEVGRPLLGVGDSGCCLELLADRPSPPWPGEEGVCACTVKRCRARLAATVGSHGGGHTQD